MTETSHDALVRQTAAAEELLDYFQGQRAEFNQNVASAQASYAAFANDLRGVAQEEIAFEATVDPDAVDPSEINGGTFSTIKEAVDASGKGAKVKLSLLAGTINLIDATIFANSRSISIICDDSSNPAAIWPTAALNETHNSVNGFVGSPSWEIFFQNIDIVMPAKLDDALPFSSYNSLLRYTPGNHVAVGLRGCTFTGTDGQSITRGNNATAVTMRLSGVTLDGDVFAAASVDNATLTLAQSATTLLNGAALTDGGTIGVEILQN